MGGHMITSIYCANCLKWFDKPREVVLHRPSMREPEESILVCPECGSEEDWKVGQKCDVVDCDGFVTKDSDYCFQHGENEVKEAELIPELKNMRSALELPRVTPA